MGGSVDDAIVGSTIKPSGPVSTIPEDLTAVESRVLEMNKVDLFPGQHINVESLLAMRCVTEDQALRLLSGLEVKGRGKGSINISNVNNYIQAAVVKIKRGFSAGETGVASMARHANGNGIGFNFTGNQTSQRARELGLELAEDTLQDLAQISLRDANFLLDAAVSVQSQGEDPNEYIRNEAVAMAIMSSNDGDSPADAHGSAKKRHRWE